LCQSHQRTWRVVHRAFATGDEFDAAGPTAGGSRHLGHVDVPGAAPCLGQLGSPPQPDLNNMAATRQAYIDYLGNARNATQQATDRTTRPR